MVVSAMPGIVGAFLGRSRRAVAVDDGKVEELVLMKLMYRARKDPVDAAIGLPAPHHPVDTRVVDFGAAFLISFDRQHHPLTPHIERLQDVVEDLVQRQRRWRSASATAQVWQDKFLRLRFAQLRRNRLPAWVSRHSLNPEIWTLTDLPSPIANPLPARLTDKFDRPEKLATSSEPSRRSARNRPALHCPHGTYADSNVHFVEPLLPDVGSGVVPGVFRKRTSKSRWSPAYAQRSAVVRKGR